VARYTPPAADYNGTPYVPTVLVWTTPFYFDGQTLQHVTVDVRWATAEPVAQRLAGTVDNRDGYQTVEAAQRVARTCADLLRDGVTTTYDLASWSDRTAGVTLEWQQSSRRDHYCGDPRVTASGDEGIAAWATKVPLFVSVEDHNVLGGMGGAVAEVLASVPRSARLHRHGILDVFGESGEPEDLYRKFRLDGPGITAVVREALGR
jgi:hypothetical protein